MYQIQILEPGQGTPSAFKGDFMLLLLSLLRKTAPGGIKMAAATAHWAAFRAAKNKAA
jgi:hypothetical protein